MYGLKSGSVPLLSPRFTSKGEKLGSTSIGVPKVSSTSFGRVTDGVYDSIDGRTYGVHCGLGLSILSSIISRSPIGSSSNHAIHLGNSIMSSNLQVIAMELFSKV
ncbi:hypothetical protein Tco_0858918 [Tanacetum coccineum]|uniref:Uncharacterized protein n=1 Tax=Tanacetum coccineum TaxID=301880 RepID=A0ABQ5BBA6_9ASTR